MTIRYLGSDIEVKVSREDIRDFSERWPCCGLSSNPIFFRFDRSSGDLIDTHGAVAPDQCCGELEALAEEAKKFANEEIKKFYENTPP